MARHCVRASSHYFSVGSAPITGFPVTFACWVKLTQLPSDIPDHFTYMTVSDGSTNDYFALYSNQANDFLEFKTDGAGTPSLNARTTVTITAGVWQHYCGVASDNANRAVYINGANKVANSGAASIPIGVDEFCIGSHHSTGLNYLDGSVACVTIWNYALSDSEVLQLADPRLHPRFIRPENIAAHYNFWSCDKDVVGGHDLTAHNVPTWVNHPGGIVLPSGVQ